MKKTIVMLLAIFILVGLVGSTEAATTSTPMFKVNGKLFVTPDGEPAPYINKDKRTMGSLRLIGAALGVESKDITWNKTTQTATLTRGDNTVAVVVGKKEITVNGKKVTMDTVAEMKQGRVFIPVRFIAQGLGATIGFENNTVLIYTGKVATNNFEDYGLTPVIELPHVLEYGGLELTVHEAFIYSTDSKEALALHQKYKFGYFDEGHYLLWTKVTLKNNSQKTLRTDYYDMLMKVSAMNGVGESMQYSYSLAGGREVLNDKEVLFDWVLKPGESVTSHIPFIDTNYGKLDFVGISVRSNVGSDYARLAVRE